MYRGVMYSIMKKENTALAIVLSSLFRGITHAVYPTVVVGGDLSVFLTDCISNIGFGFIYVFEESKTLWIPILLHAVYDYSMGYGWIIFVGTVMYLYIVNKGGHTRQK